MVQRTYLNRTSRWNYTAQRQTAESSCYILPKFDDELLGLNSVSKLYLNLLFSTDRDIPSIRPSGEITSSQFIHIYNVKSYRINIRFWFEPTSPY